MWLGSRRIVRDISRAKQAESALRESEAEARQARERAQQYLDIAAVVIVALDASGTVTLINRRGCELLGYEEAEIVGKDWFTTVLPEAERDRVRAAFDGTLCGERSAARYYEHLLLSRDRREIPVAWHNAWLREEEGEIVGVVSSGVDLTETKRLTAKLIEQESLAKLGEMSAIVAHEVKNPLSGIVGAARMLKRRLPEASVEREIVEEMIARAESLNEGVKDLLAFSRPRAPRKRPIPMDALLEDVVAFVANDPQFAAVEVDLACESTVALCDPEMLKPVVPQPFRQRRAGDVREGKDPRPCRTRQSLLHDHRP